MRTDHLFFRLFQALPETLFELIAVEPPPSSCYSFQSVEVKETALRIDGVFVPTAAGQPFYFVEVQFQKDSDIYWRLFIELLLYMRQQNLCADWRAVAIFPEQSQDVDVPESLRDLADGPRFKRVYLNTLRVTEASSLRLGLVELIAIKDEGDFIEGARQLLRRTRQQTVAEQEGIRLLGLIETVIVYKLSYSREEIEAMFGLEELKKTRYFQEVAEEARQKGLQEGRQEGRQEGELTLIVRILTKKFGTLEPEISEKLRRMTIQQLETFAEASLDFANIAQLNAWLEESGS
ncbi:Rpn family recombination-promoting nuclease/putative transposase [Gloeobacter violaceus]|uniref:Glr2142 protein n=1 Tax=Gloeobacter violaceus (strain ATCC 29082 / PCC 7421) TaxID=251221 RepID=Q7NIP1_GLOVI|nr:Rpn family recombination-promoting nuclease/putative transposase [Gloeobacter violaceus]BAC90083.1 glr2142 [Gloeobacter violaceus PCC 7421]